MGYLFVGRSKLKQVRVVAGIFTYSAIHHDSRCKLPIEPMKDLQLSLFSQLGTTIVQQSAPKANQPTPPNVPRPRNKGLIRPYFGKRMVNKPLTRPYFWGGVRWGGGGGLISQKKVTSSPLDFLEGLLADSPFYPPV